MSINAFPICGFECCNFYYDGNCMNKDAFDECELNNQEEAIPVSFIRDWFKEHYGTELCALVDAWVVHGKDVKGKGNSEE